MPKTAVKIGPQDHGRHMSLEEFDHAEVQEGYLYELARRVIVVSDVPNFRHLVQVKEIRRQLNAYDLAHPGRIYFIAAGSDCKILVSELESERHPDVALYRKLPPSPTGNFWATWIPDIVIEVVSPGAESERRDYVEKREEYLELGIKEYWIFDADRDEMLVLRRSGDQWSPRTIRPGKIYRTRLLPGLEFDCALVFAAAQQAGDNEETR
jgi:Uma2 family endonuclease